jgi:hypothetical protein
VASSIGAIGQKAIDTPHGWRALAGAWIAAQQRQLILFAPVAFAGGIALWFGLPFNSQRQAALLLALAIALSGLGVSGLVRRLTIAFGLLLAL